jgi:acetolactate synthase-1/3 small subunit
MRARDRDARAGRRRRPRDARGEHLPDDRARRRRARHGGVIAMGEPGTKAPLSLEELDAAVGLRTGRKHVLSILVENRPGRPDADRGPVRAPRLQHRDADRRPDRRREFSRVTLTVDGALHPIDQVTKQLHKLVNVLKIRDLEPAGTVHARAGAVQGQRRGAARSELLEFTEIFRGKVVDTTKRSVTVEVTGDEREDRRVRARRPPLRADRDDAHRRDRDVARTLGDLVAHRVDCGARLGPRRRGGDRFAAVRAAGAQRLRFEAQLPHAPPAVRAGDGDRAAVSWRLADGSIRAPSCSPRAAPASRGCASSSPSASARHWPRSARS